MFFGRRHFNQCRPYQSILALPEPECIKDNRGFLGTLNYVRRSIDGYAEIRAPLVELTRKGFVKKTAFKKAFGPVNLLLARNEP